MDNGIPPTTLGVPCGWKRGEPLVVSKRMVHHQSVWFVEQKPKFKCSSEFNGDHIAARWFYTFEEFAEFLQWWTFLTTNKEK